MVKYNTSIPAHDYNQPYNCIHINMISMHQDTPIHKVDIPSYILHKKVQTITRKAHKSLTCVF